MLALIGWIINKPFLFQPISYWLGMQFNAALCIVLTALAVFALLLKRRRLAFILILLSGLIAGLTMLEYLTGQNLMIDQLFVVPYASLHSNYPDRMAPNTAFSILLLNGAILLYCQSSTPFTKLMQLTMAVLALGIGLIGLIGYLLDIKIVYHWSGFVAMPMHAGLCLMLLGSALALFFYMRYQPYYSGHGVLQTMSIMVAGMLFFILIWQNFVEDAAMQTRKKIAADSTMIANEIELTIKDNYFTATNFFSRLDETGFNEAMIKKDSENYLQDVPNVSLIAWGPKLTNIQAEYPTTLNEVQLASTQCSAGLHKETLSSNIINNAATQWRASLCFNYQGKRHGLMLFNLQQIMAMAVKRSNTKLTGISIQYGDVVIFNQINEAPLAYVKEWAYIQSLRLDFLNKPIVFKLWPSPRFVSENTPWLPLLTIIMGLIITSLLAAVNHLKNKTALDNSKLKTSISDKSKKLMEIETRYQRIYDSSPDLLLFVDTTCHVIECNQTFMRTMGIIKKQNIINHSVFDILGVKNTTFEKNIMTRLAATGVINNQELDLINQFDSTSRMMLKVSPFMQNNKTIGYLFSFRDVSNIKALQEELASKKISENLFQENKAIYDLILDETTDGWWDINLEAKECVLSSKLLKSLGYDKENFTPTFDFFRDHALPDDFKLIEKNLKQHLLSQGQYPFHQEVRYRHRDGQLVWILCRGQGILDADGKIRRMVGTHIDISALKHAQEKLSLKNLELDLINKTTRLILVTPDIHEAFKACVTKITKAIQFNVGIVYLYNAEKNRLVANSVWHRHIDAHDHDCIEAMSKLIFKEGEGIAGRVWHERKTLWLETKGDKQSLAQQALCKHFQFSGVLAFPILVAENIYAVFEFLCQEIRHQTSEELDMVDLLAAQMSLAVERKMAYSQLHHLALHDELTKLPNRRACMEMLEMAISRASRSKSEVGLMFLDLDDFKQVNDSLGHHIGDLLLIEVTRRFKQSLRSHDYLSRLAGDEFLLIVTDLSSHSILSTLAERLMQSLEEPLLLENNEVKVSVSIGIAIYPSAGKTIEALLQKADAALYQAKNEGKKGFFFTRPEHHSEQSHK